MLSTTATTWALLAITCFVLGLGRPAWAVALYMLTFFAAPHLWWWGDELPSARYALWAGVFMLVAIALNSGRNSADQGRRLGLVHAAAGAMILNALFVHFVLAVDRSVSIDTLIELAKYTLLTFLMAAAIRSKDDLRLVMVAVALGCLYIGYEVTINDRGDFRASRLEGVGAPGAVAANSLADLMLVSLPLIGSLFVEGSRKTKIIAAVAAPFALNVLLLCNSRGAFLGLIGGGIAFFVIARGQTRKEAIRALLLGGLALYLLLGDPKILDRFSTTFVGSEQRDSSAAGRIEYWRAGVAMLADYPLGAGGGAFKWVLGARYAAVVSGRTEDRSLHNGFLTEATDWGIQGLFLKMLFIGAALWAAYRTSNACRIRGQTRESLVGLSLIVAMAAYLIHCMFGAFLASEWGYWVVGLLLSYSYLYAPEPAVSALPSRSLERAESAA